MNGLTLAEKMKEYEIYSDKLAELEQEIKDEVFSLGKSQSVGRTKATFYPDGKGSFDWESIAKFLEPDDSLIDSHTVVTTTIKWNKIAEELKASDELKNSFYTPGKPFVSLSVK